MKLAYAVVSIVLAFNAALAKVVPQQPGAKRGLAEWLQIIADFNDKVIAVGAAVDAYTGGSGVDVLDAFDDLIASLNAGYIALQPEPPLSPSDALALVAPIQNLIADWNAVADSLVAQSPLFVANGLDYEVLDSLQLIKGLFEDLIALIRSKLPSSLEELIVELLTALLAPTQRAIDEFFVA